MCYIYILYKVSQIRIKIILLTIYTISSIADNNKETQRYTCIPLWADCSITRNLYGQNIILSCAISRNHNNGKWVKQTSSDTSTRPETSILIDYSQFKYRWSLSTTTVIRRDLKEYRKQQESMLMPPVNYLRVVGCEHVAEKGVERIEGYRIGHRSSKRRL